MGEEGKGREQEGKGGSGSEEEKRWELRVVCFGILQGAGGQEEA